MGRSGVALALLLLAASCTGPERRTVDPCREIESRILEGYQAVIDGHAGHDVERFAERGLFEVPEADARLDEIEGAARTLGCNPLVALARVINRGHELRERGAGQALAKALLLGRASNTVFFGPSGVEERGQLPALPPVRVPADATRAEDIAAVDPRSLETCEEVAEAEVGVQQAQLNEIARVDPQRLLGGAAPAGVGTVTRVRQGLLRRAAALECSEEALTRALLERADSLDAQGFFANVAKAERIERAWTTLADDLARVELSLRIERAAQPAPAAEEIAVRYVVENTGTVPMAGVRVEDRRAGEIDLDRRFLEPGQEAVGTATVDVGDRPRVSARVLADDPFGDVFEGSASARVADRR